MACAEVHPDNMESEREEGEIVDELDDLSDISSEEEFLLRQRLEILENYNNVLERKEAKRTSLGTGKPNKTKPSFWQDFTKVIDDKNDSKTQEVYRVTRTEKYLKKTKKLKEQPKDSVPIKNNRKKYTRNKKVHPMKVVSETSEDSEDDEYKNKRRKLADAVTLNKNKVDTSSLKDRLAKMLNSKPTKTTDSFIIQNSIILTGPSTKPVHKPSLKANSKIMSLNNDSTENTHPLVLSDMMDTDDDVKIIETVGEDSHDTVDAGNVEKKKDVQLNDSGASTDEDIESLRQLALKTKSSKLKIALPDVQNIVANKPESEDEDSDTAELRMICLRSALLKKAIEMKKKQKLQKRLSQNSIMEDSLYENCNNDRNENENNTDIENVDMEIGSDGDEKSKDGCDNNIFHEYDVKNLKQSTGSVILTKEDELEEDEDLLRAKLLTSLSKNLPNLVDINTFTNSEVEVAREVTIKPKTEVVNKINIPEDKKFIIELGDSDSEGEHEATKNLTKMHMKLAEQTEFQQKLDQFLKSTRLEVEKNALPDVVLPQAPTKPPQKFVPKAMNHLPKSEQIEYRNLVKRMAELEKLKQARQLSLNNFNKPSSKETLKPRNNSVNNMEMSAKKLEEKIATSRKMIAEESAKMLKLKEEATKLSQRYKIVSNELRNITTAITLNKKQQRNVQNGLSKIRLHHQMLLKSSTTLKHSIPHPPSNTANKVINSTKKQKENDPLVKEHKNPTILKSVKVSVINDLNKDTPTNNPRLSVEIDVSSNTKVVKANTPTKERTVDFQKTEDHIGEFSNPATKSGGKIDEERNKNECQVKDYTSPLDALGRTDWKEDPNAFLCPFEVGGTCRDTDCKFLHLKSHTQ
ncbi:DNA repair protein RAD50-like [Zerene cesonia]|uniref:DNA repair protein RAD50-like n=1 Tax=Zerene cesonia TaxID=33412 RepID=UPI0018E52D55|nr:DNA repair protein RAD50-like [Zerene cesonia]